MARVASRIARFAIGPLALAACVPVVSCQFGTTRPSRAPADGLVVETVDSSFVRDVMEPGRPSVVYYYAHGCIPCGALGPHVRKLAARFAGRVTFWSLNRGWSAERVQRYGVRAVPTLVFYSGAHEVARQVGMPLDHTDDALDRFVEAGMSACSPAAPARREEPGRRAPVERQ